MIDAEQFPEKVVIHTLIREKMITQAHQWVTERAYILDTETTGLDKQAQVVEIAVTDTDGQVIFQRRLRPSVPIDLAAQDVHGITLSALRNEPQWPQIADELIPLLTRRPLIIFNAKFDLRIIAQTAKAFAMDTRWLKQVQSQCAMELAAWFYGATNRYGTISLANAARAAGVSVKGKAHTAVVDCQTTAAVVRSIANLYPQLK
ncbi:DNA polymerase III subunit epsilon [Xenorhabdus beddingii]|uniref:DNA polymerase III subunit epsilon n=1 Tax=Xenorhabdus beddingii TaxID=40578 RepID=A0A1Y2SJN6_9GAMM|nr:3'-5' exonuclease [Xenorhabdus beddingii]OTA19053.1 DNA polymerase III subunit epsilon [Xenorhabdus beddingii]